MATRTIANGGGNYNATGTWVEGAVPTSADDVVATGTSGQLTVNVSSAAKTADFTNYVSTLTLNANLTVSGSVTFVAAMTIAGTNLLTINATATLTSNGKTLSGGLLLSGVSTITLADNWTITGLVQLANGGNALSVGGAFQINCNNGLRYNGSSAAVTGAAIFNISATGTMDAPSWTSGRITNKIYLDAGAGTVTISNTFMVDLGNVKYISGTIAAAAGTWASGSSTSNVFMVFD